MQTRIPCMLARGGTSKGAYFLAADLPTDARLLNQVLLTVMGSPDARQIDGVGGANPLTSKVAIVKPSQRPGIDVDYLFVQVSVDEPLTTTQQNCGNILAGVGPFAIERNLVAVYGSQTTLTVYMENSASIAKLRVQTFDGIVSYEGSASIDGVPGTHAPVMIEFLDTIGSSCGALFPTGNVCDIMEGVPVTLIDNGMPVVLVAADDVGVSGYESKLELDQDMRLKQWLERIRLKAGAMMNLGDVADKTVPKMTLVAPPKAGGLITSRTFIPHLLHSTIGVLGAVSVATACMFPGSVAHGLAHIPEGNPKLCSVEHPSGEFSVELELGQDGDSAKPVITTASVLRTARPIFDGAVLIPSSVWDGVSR
jgi:4-oxalomesaconate tautomerase